MEVQGTASSGPRIIETGDVMSYPTRRIALLWFVAASLSAVTGCSEREVVVGPGTGGSKRGIKGQEDAKRKDRPGRPEK